jgi:hypothetical protein
VPSQSNGTRIAPTGPAGGPWKAASGAWGWTTGTSLRRGGRPCSSGSCSFRSWIVAAAHAGGARGRTGRPTPAFAFIWNEIPERAGAGRRSGAGGKGAGGGDDIVTLDEYDDFELVLEWKIRPKGNSGVRFRVVEQSATSWHESVEMQVLDNGPWPNRSKKELAGAAYDMYAPARDVTRAVGEWNRARLVADGPRIEHWLNGEKLLEYEIGSEDRKQRLAASKFRDKPLYARAPKGRICLQDHSDRIEYRNLKIRPIVK